MSAEVFTGRAGAMRVSPWLASEDLDGLGDVLLTIEGVYSHKDAVMQDGRKQAQLYAVKFAKRERQLVLNATNRKALVAKFGTDTKQWIGKEVTLYVKDGVRSPSGGTTKGIRIK